MDVPNSERKFYTGFIERSDTNDVRIDVGETLKVNFDPDERVETENWTASVIEPLPFAPWGELCIVFFRTFNKETGEYDERELNTLPTDTVSLAEATSRVSRHPAHQIALDRNLQTKTFRRQIAELRKLRDYEDYGWWREFLLGKNVTPMFYTDIYSRCSSSAKSLLDTNKLNAAQRKAVDLVKRLPNGVGLITGPAATGKTALLVTMVKLFLWAPATKSGDNDSVKPTLDFDDDAGENVVDIALGFDDGAADNVVDITLDFDDGAADNVVEPTWDFKDDAAGPTSVNDSDHGSAGILLCAPRLALHFPYFCDYSKGLTGTQNPVSLFVGAEKRLVCYSVSNKESKQTKTSS
ncbi:hypothetical protein MMC29_000894 [Sticta canariensis]|nr:hypothetical protein [Sticta canariensis]